MREIAAKLPKPSHYAGLEDGAVIKDPASLALRIALAFPDTYEVGMSYLGQKILYGIVNDNPEWAAERVMCPEPEAAEIIKASGAPLATLETDTDLKDMDAVCFSVTHELCFTDILHMLDLAGIPLRTEDRGDSLSVPLVMAGGGAMMGAEALSPFIDLAALGDGEELLPEILILLQEAKREKWSRAGFLEKASFIPGVYVPSLFKMNERGELEPLRLGYRPQRRVVTDLNKAPYPARQVAPISAVHNRLSLEIARGCTRGCRFCHAGMVYRPPRERGLEKLGALLDQCLDSTGFEEASFLSLSAGDYSALGALFDQSYSRCARDQITLALPSLRASSVGADVLKKMASLRRAGMTLAPEAGTQRLRDVINKGITEEEILNHIELLASLGWQRAKLYFMIGLPAETDEDLAGIFELCKKSRAAGSRFGKRMQVTASVSTFTPKAFTPFQWEAQSSLEDIERKISFLKNLFKSEKGLELRWHEPKASHLEGVLSRSDRRLADVVEKAYRKGALYCGWSERFKLEPWLEALDECGLKAEDYTGARSLEDKLPWEHLECGVSRDFLLRERNKAYGALLTPDCRWGQCGNCGVCDRPAMPSPLAKSPDGLALKCRLVFPQRDQKSGIISPPPEPEKKTAAKPAQGSGFHYRLWHKKMGAFSLISQLELQAIIEKALRRAKLPLAFSQGFHPMPKISFGRALPVGVESQAEWAAFTLTEDMEPELVKSRLNAFLKEEIKIFDIKRSDNKSKTAQAAREAFAIYFPDAPSLQKAQAAFASLMEKSSLPYVHKTKKGEKEIDIRRLLAGFFDHEDQGALRFTADWSQGYLSPLALVSEILKTGAAACDGIRLIKEAQLFEK